MPVRLGYACISLVQKEIFGVYTNRTLILSTLHKKGADEAIRLARLNADDLLKILAYNETNGLRFFRLTSALMPHAGNPDGLVYDMDCIAPQLRAAGEFARQHGHRITCHPGQFAQLGSPRPEVTTRTAADLEMHASVFRAMGLEPRHGSVMIIHGGGAFGDKPGTLQRWRDNFRRLPHWVASYIALENDEWTYSILDLLPVCEELQIPLCVDFFHHQIQTDSHELTDDIIARCMRTWSVRGIKPKCHWSNQAPGERKGTHGACVADIPARMLDICRRYDVDIMLETKQKDLCTLRMLEQHFTKTTTNGRVDWVLDS